MPPIKIMDMIVIFVFAAVSWNLPDECKRKPGKFQIGKIDTVEDFDKSDRLPLNVPYGINVCGMLRFVMGFGDLGASKYRCFPDHVETSRVCYYGFRFVVVTN